MFDAGHGDRARGLKMSTVTRQHYDTFMFVSSFMLVPSFILVPSFMLVLFLAAMSSSRSDVVTLCVRSFVCLSLFLAATSSSRSDDVTPLACLSVC